MSDQDIFQQTSETTKPTETPTNPTNAEDLLKSIVAEDGRQKYNTVEDAIKALAHSQQFIETLQQEKRDIEAEKTKASEELGRMKSVEEFVEMLKSKEDTTQNKQVETPPSTVAGVTEEQAEKLVSKMLEDKEQKASQASNLKQVIDVVTQKYGDKSAEHISNVAQEMGVSTEQMKDLAKSSPKMVLSLLLKEADTISPSTSTTTVPRQTEEQNERPVIERGVARGGFTSKELLDLWGKSKAYTDKRIGVS